MTSLRIFSWPCATARSPLNGTSRRVALVDLHTEIRGLLAKIRGLLECINRFLALCGGGSLVDLLSLFERLNALLIELLERVLFLRDLTFELRDRLLDRAERGDRGLFVGDPGRLVRTALCFGDALVDGILHLLRVVLLVAFDEAVASTDEVRELRDFQREPPLSTS